MGIYSAGIREKVAVFRAEKAAIGFAILAYHFPLFSIFNRGLDCCPEDHAWV